MYQRILDTEIAVAGGDQAPSNGSASKAGSSAQNLKLAAAMGLTQLMLPFRSATRLLTHCWVSMGNMGLLKSALCVHPMSCSSFACALHVLQPASSIHAQV